MLHRLPGLRRQPRGGRRADHAAVGGARRPRPARRAPAQARPAESFVPYVGCLVDRERALASLADAAALSGARIELSYPALARRLLRRPGRHVSRLHGGRAAPAGLRRRAPRARRHAPACCAATTCARPRAARTSTFPSTSGPSSSAPAAATQPRTERHMTEKSKPTGGKAKATRRRPSRSHEPQPRSRRTPTRTPIIADGSFAPRSEGRVDLVAAHPRRPAHARPQGRLPELHPVRRLHLRLPGGALHRVLAARDRPPRARGRRDAAHRRQPSGTASTATPARAAARATTAWP